MPGTHLPEISVESATQTEDQIRAVLGTLGYDGIETSSQSDHPELEPEVPAVEETPAAPSESQPDGEAGDPAGDPDPEPQAAGEPPAPKKKPGSARAKEQAQHAKAEAESLRLENAELKRKLAAQPAGTVETPKLPVVETPKAEPKVEAKPKPNPDEFEQGVYDPAYVEAVADWRYEERDRIKAETQRSQKEAEELAQKTKAETDAKTKADAELKAEMDRWNSSVETAKTRFPDYDQVMNAPREKPVPQALVYAVRTRDDVETAELAYWLAMHPEDEAKLVALTKDLPATPSQRQFESTVRKIDRALDGIVESLQAYEPSEDPEEPPAPPASREARVPAASSAAGPAAKAPPQNPPPQAAPPPAPAPKPKPAVPSTVGGRGATQSMSEMAKAQKGLPVDPDKFRKEWEAKNGALPI